MSGFVSVESTPNPLVKKFATGSRLARVPFDATTEAANDPVVERLLRVGASTIFVGQDHLAVGVTRTDDWASLLGPIRDVISASGDLLPFLAGRGGNAAGNEETSSDPVVAMIIDLLDTRIRPAVAHDGGDVRFHAFRDGVLELEMAGACSGCPSSSATLKQGILSMMRYFVPEVRDVVAV